MQKSQEELYSEFVDSLVKPGEQMCEEITPFKAHLNHMAMLLAGECGELVDAIKKHTIYGKDLDYVNVIEELGDIEFALEAIRKAFTISREEVLAHNVDKLTKRYNEGRYSDQAAKDRADKQLEITIDEDLISQIPDAGVVDHD
jgi:NTP pyrophosphatase (non-canonical NTP hydrolase)